MESFLLKTALVSKRTMLEVLSVKFVNFFGTAKYVLHNFFFFSVIPVVRISKKTTKSSQVMFVFGETVDL